MADWSSSRLATGHFEGRVRCHLFPHRIEGGPFLHQAWTLARCAGLDPAPGQARTRVDPPGELSVLPSPGSEEKPLALHHLVDGRPRPGLEAVHTQDGGIPLAGKTGGGYQQSATAGAPAG